MIKTIVGKPLGQWSGGGAVLGCLGHAQISHRQDKQGDDKEDLWDLG